MAKPKIKRISKNTATFFVLGACFLSVVVLRFFNGYSQVSYALKMEMSRSKGHPRAPLQIIEYIDFECPACAQGALFLKDFTKKYPREIYLQMRYYPLSQMHPYALRTALYAECASRQGKFWEVHDELVAKQILWKKMVSPEPMFRDMAVKAQVDLELLNVCLEDQKVKDKIFAEKSEGSALGVKSTPTYFVNGKIIVGIKNLRAELDQYIKAKGLK